jgi:hypothetical protein
LCVNVVDVNVDVNVDVVDVKYSVLFSDVSAIARPVTDITPINGYLDYPESLTSRVVALTTTDNDLPEDEEKYSVILVSSRGGADIDSSSNSVAKLTGIAQLLKVFIVRSFCKIDRCL